ncbi:MAG: HEPN domain-containing protein [Nanoarchaeota archaeon]
MKKINFLKKVKKEGKIALIDPSEEIKQSYIEKSESNLISAKILLDSNRLEESVGLAYYSMYHLLAALLFKIGIKSENHSASIILLKELFNLENKDIFQAKTERIDKQYYVGFKITKEEVLDTIKKAEIFNGKIIDFISKVNNKDIEDYRGKFQKIFE